MKPLSGLLAALAVVLGAAAAEAQYFGQNKVQYREFDFRVLQTPHFDIYYYPEEQAAVQLAARMAERWYTRLSTVLDHKLSSRQPVILYASHPHFEQTNVLEESPGEGTGGVTEPFKRRVILPFAGGLAETDHVLGHELVHAFQFDMASEHNTAGQPTGPAVNALPLWFIEGMAEYLSLGPVDSQTAMWLRDATARNKLPTVKKLNDPEFFPYRYGHAFWAYVGGRWGDRIVGDMLRAAGPKGDYEAAIIGTLGIDADTLSRDWHDAIRRTYAGILETTAPPSRFARPLITHETGSGELNVAPSLSPDGSKVVFLSERELLSIDMFLADAQTGKIIRRLVKTAADPHFDSLQFLGSAGSWHPDGRRFVFAAIARGKPVLTLIDTATAAVEREVPLQGIDEVFNPAWSPDGRRIAFSALQGGVLDLFVYDLDAQRLDRLTDDAFADLDPRWAPDGSGLAFVTDRFGSNLQELAFGNYRIGWVDAASHRIRALAGFSSGRNLNPQWTSNGRTLYFIADPDGIPNVYRLDVASAVTTKLTNVQSGVAGITPLTPALSAAADGSRVVFSVFQDNGYDVYAMDHGGAAVRQTASTDGGQAGVLPPAQRQSLVEQGLRNARAGLPSQTTPFQTTPYTPRLSLDMIGQPTVGIGADRFGAYGAGGVSLMFSDMLGNHMLATTAQVSSRLDESGGIVGYLNRTHRWNWGVIGEQTPYVVGGVAAAEAVVGGQPLVIEEERRILQVNRGASFVAQYPFSRAQRIEFAAGFRQVSFSDSVFTRTFAATTGDLLQERKRDLPTPDALKLAETSAALVYDTSMFGATSPILGQRYRLEYTQMSGSVLYGGALADYRRYVMPLRPFTVAVRGLHYGRYGRDSEDPRLAPLFLGYPGLVRGYEAGSFDTNECVPGDVDCPAFDRLTGSRMMLASAELRFPIVGLFNRRTYYGPLPIELAVFGDAGVAWTSDQRPTWFGGDKAGVRSVGTALRVNVLGFAIAEIDYVRPLDRPVRGWMWQFNLTPGW